MTKPSGHMEISAISGGGSLVFLNGEELFVLADSLTVNADGESLTTVTLTIAVEKLTIRAQGAA